ncbi:MAG: hypothetical protein J5I90_10830 [Caldilineales bacterium]|nr:hypothetical protein [Caldilineales bacterium]
MLDLNPAGPLIVARRGARALAPENTLPAFELAVEQGADAIEMDVQFTSDGKLIIMHGLEVDEISDGTGRIRSFTFDEIRELDVGGWFSERYKGLRVPTLTEALDTLAGRVKMVLEMKTFTRKSEGMETDTWAEIKRRGLADAVTVTSFNPYALRRLKKLAPSLRTGLMQATGLPPWYSGSLARRFSQADDLHAEMEFVNDKLVTKLRRPLWLMTVNDEQRLAQALKWHPVGLITDDPAWLRSALERRSA